ncbi:MAG: glycosyltransferase, partial [Bdellovibrionales bacterium]|nr:glycosyltransferase [Bdellovibrionales bacterium]
MNILMVSNTYLPHIGGVALSVSRFSEAYRQRGHRVLVLAPTFEGMEEEESDVVRIPAIQNFNGSDFSVRLPIPTSIYSRLSDFQPDIVHSHHPFLLGDSALRIASGHNVPLVFTHHTMYEQYTHYAPGDSPEMKEFVIELGTGYANLANHVIAPSADVGIELQRRGVTTPISVIPTGVVLDDFSSGDGIAFRRRFNISEDAFVVGHVGRLAPEKNLRFLSDAVASFLSSHPNAVFVVIGEGPSRESITEKFAKRGCSDRLFLPGRLTGRSLADGYAAMNVFAFASFTETQGMVLAEAMAAGVPVVAVDAPGVNDVVCDGKNGVLLPAQDRGSFVRGL